MNVLLNLKYVQLNNNFQMSNVCLLLALVTVCCLISWLTVAVQRLGFMVVERFATAVDTRNPHKYTAVCLLVTKEGIQSTLEPPDSPCLNEPYVHGVISWDKMYQTSFKWLQARDVTTSYAGNFMKDTALSIDIRTWALH